MPRCTCQNQHSVSIPRESLIDLAEYDLSKVELRVVLVLLSTLSGWQPSANRSTDPNNFKPLKPGKIAEIVGTDKEHVKNILVKLENLDIIERGKSNYNSKGYRFTF